MAYSSKNSPDPEQIEQAHEQLAENHGEENVYVASGDNNSVLTIISDGIGEFLENADEVEMNNYDYNSIKRPGDTITKFHGGVNFLEHMELVGFPENPRLVFKTDDVEFGWDHDTEWSLKGSNHFDSVKADNREEARTYAILTALRDVDADPNAEQYDFEFSREYFWLTELVATADFDPEPFFEEPASDDEKEKEVAQ